MARKKPKRFNEGGISEEQLKAEGLEASKGDKVGFFERLRMGNIDQEGSDAYNRFGAGRGRAARAAVTKPVYDIGYEGRDPVMAQEMDPLEAANSSKVSQDLAKYASESGVKMPAQSALAGTSGSGGRKPIKLSSQAAKSKPIYDYGNERTSDYSNEGRGRAAAKSLVNQIPTDKATAVVGERTEPMSDTRRNISNAMAVAGGGAGVAGLYKLGKTMLNARKAAKAGAQKRANLKRDVEEGIDRNLVDELQEMTASAAKRTSGSTRPTEASRSIDAGRSVQKSPANKTKRFDDESNIEFKRGGSVKKKPEVKKMASGGMTSKASSRGDGIAQRGKTRGKIC